jgi:hypothetical protein
VCKSGINVLGLFTVCVGSVVFLFSGSVERLMDGTIHVVMSEIPFF